MVADRGAVRCVCQRYAGEITLPCEAAVRVGRTLVLVVLVCVCVLRADGTRHADGARVGDVCVCVAGRRGACVACVNALN
jgi:hypothetical protein